MSLSYTTGRYREPLRRSRGTQSYYEDRGYRRGGSERGSRLRRDRNSDHHHHHHHHHHYRKLIVRERAISFSGFDYSVYSGRSGERKYDIREDKFSLHGTCTIRDHEGRARFRMKDEWFSPRGLKSVYDCRSDVIVATVRRRSAVPLHLKGGGTILVWKGDRESGVPWLEIRGDYKGREFFVLDGVFGEEVAYIHRRAFSPKYILLGKCTYDLTVLKRVDDALMSFLVIALDDYFR